MVAGDFLYKTQVKWFPISRERYDMVMYSLIGLMKTGFILLNLTPFLVLTFLL